VLLKLDIAVVAVVVVEQAAYAKHSRSWNIDQITTLSWLRQV
jgi:hypothetical protein